MWCRNWVYRIFSKKVAGPEWMINQFISIHAFWAGPYVFIYLLDFFSPAMRWNGFKNSPAEWGTSQAHIGCSWHTEIGLSLGGCQQEPAKWHLIWHRSVKRGGYKWAQDCQQESKWTDKEVKGWSVEKWAGNVGGKSEEASEGEKLKYPLYVLHISPRIVRRWMTLNVKLVLSKSRKKSACFNYWLKCRALKTAKNLEYNIFGQR